MHLNQARLIYQLVWFEAGDRLGTTKQLLAYLTASVPDDAESFWIACMNPNRRPICRIRLKTGLLVASQIGVREAFLPILLSEARAFACLRTQRDGPVRPNLADGRLAWSLRETAALMNVEFVDYIVARLDTDDYYSTREHNGRTV